MPSPPRMQVLLVLPLRNLARRAVLRLCQLAQEETRSDSIQGKARFLEEYADEPLSGETTARVLTGLCPLACLCVGRGRPASGSGRPPGRCRAVQVGAGLPVWVHHVTRTGS